MIKHFVDELVKVATCTNIHNICEQKPKIEAMKCKLLQMITDSLYAKVDEREAWLNLSPTEQVDKMFPDEVCKQYQERKSAMLKSYGEQVEAHVHQQKVWEDLVYFIEQNPDCGLNKDEAQGHADHERAAAKEALEAMDQVLGGDK